MSLWLLGDGKRNSITVKRRMVSDLKAHVTNVEDEAAVMRRKWWRRRKRRSDEEDEE